MGRKKREKRKDKQPRRRSRVLAAWHVLIGRASTIEQIQGEWSVIQAQAAEVFNRFNALAARLVRAEKNALKANLDSMAQLELDVPTARPAVDRAAHKQELRKRARERATGTIGRIANVHGDQGGEVPG